MRAPPVRVGRRFAQRTTDDSVVFLYFKKRSLQLPMSKKRANIISILPVTPRLGRSKEFKKTKDEERSVLCT